MYELKLFNNSGIFVGLITKYFSLQIGRQKNDVGSISLLISNEIFTTLNFQEDYLLEIYRDGKLLNNTLWIYQKFFEENNIIEVVFFDHLQLLKRRWNVWFQLKDTSGLTQYPTQFQLPADDICKYILYHNYDEGAIDATNNPEVVVSIPQPTAIIAYDPINRVNNYILIDPIESLAPVVTAELNKKNLLDCCKTAVNLSNEQNTNLWFDFEYIPNTTNYTSTGILKFKTWVDIRGNKLTNFVLSSNNNTLTGIKYSEDYSEKVSLMFAFGKDVPPEASTYNDQISEYAELENKSIFYPIEYLVDNSEITLNDILNGYAKSELIKRKTKISFSATILQVNGLRFFEQYNYGDVVLVEYKNKQFEVEIDKYSITIENGIESIQLSFNLEV